MAFTKRTLQRPRTSAPAEIRMWGYLQHIENLAIQREQFAELVAAGCQPDRIYIENASTHRSKRRTELQKLKKATRDGEVIVFVSMFEAVAGFGAMMDFIDWASDAGCDLLFVRESCDTRSLEGRLMVSACYQHMENRLVEIRRSTKCGLKAAKRRGSVGGRPSVMDDEALARARKMIAARSTMTEVAAALGVTRATLYNAGLSGPKKWAARKGGPKDGGAGR